MRLIDRQRKVSRLKPLRSGALYSALGLASVAALQIAIRSTSALWFVGISGLGAILGAISLWGLSILIAGQSDEDSRRHRLVVSAAVCGAGASLAALGAALGRASAATTGIALAIVGVVIFANAWTNRPPPRPEAWVMVGLLGVLAGLSLASTLGGRLVPGLALTVASLSAVKVGATGWMASNPDGCQGLRSRRAAALIGGGALLVVLAILVGLVISIGGATVGAAGLAFVGLSIVGVGAIGWLEHKRRAQFTSAGLGLFLVVSGWCLSDGLLPHWFGLAMLLSLTLTLVGSFFVFRGEAIVGLVLFGAFLGWVLIDRTVDWEAPAESSGRILALGDSFTSGEGLEAFLPLTNTTAEEGNNCRRSVDSYPFLVGIELNYDVRSFACSGATIVNVVGLPDVDDQDCISPAANEDESGEDGSGEETANGGEEAGQKDNGKEALVPGALIQLASTDCERYGLNGDQPDLVLLTIGGNDASFADLITGCILPSRCDSQSGGFLQQTESLVADLTNAYNAVTEKFPSAALIVLHYPAYLGADECEKSLEGPEVAFANMFLNSLNEAVTKAARNASGTVVVFDGMQNAWATRTLCDSAQGANFIQFVPNNGPILERLNPGSWHRGTGHPNELGHRCTAESLVRFLVDEDLVERPSEPAKPGCPLASESTIESRKRSVQDNIDQQFPNGIVSDKDSDFDGSVWLKHEAKSLVPRLSLIVVLFLGGGMLLALAAIGLLPNQVEVFVPRWLVSERSEQDLV